MTVPFSFGPGNPFARDKTAQGRRKKLSVAELLAILPEHVLGLEEPERLPPIPIQVAADATRRAKAPRMPAAPSIGPAPTRAALKSQEEVIRQTALANAKLRPKALSTAGDLLVGPETMRLLTEDGSLTPGVGVETLLTAAPFIGPVAKRALRAAKAVPLAPAGKFIGLLPEIEKVGGATLTRAGEHYTGGGFSVGLGGGKPIPELTPQAVRKTLSSMPRNANFGVWKDSRTGQWFVEPSEVIDDVDDAIAAAYKRGEKAIWDHKNGESLLLLEHYSGKGVPKGGVLDPKFAGTGAAGRETLRPGRPNALHYYMPGTKDIEWQFKGMKKMVTAVPESKVVDIGNPSPEVQKLLKGAKNPDEIERRLARAGLYYFNPDYPQIVKGFQKAKVYRPDMKSGLGERGGYKYGYIGPRAAATVMPGLTGAGVGASVGAAEDEENRLRGALMSGAAGALGGAALGHGADALGWKLRQGRINRAIDRAEEPNRAAMRAIMKDEELLAAKRSGLELKDYGASSNKNAITGRVVGPDGSWVINLDPKMLTSLKGLKGEEGRINPEKVKKLVASMKEKGFDPKQAVAVDVLPDGSVRIYEGNHRVRAAAELGIPVPTEVRYIGGANHRKAPWFPSPAGRAGNERGAIGYSYQTKSRKGREPYDIVGHDADPSRFSALDKFIREGEFGRKTPKPLQHWLGYLRKNVGKGGYTREELEGYLGPAIEKKAAQVRGERNPYKGPRGVFTRDQLLSQFDFSPLTLQEDVYGLPKRQTAREVAWTRLTVDNRVLSRTEAEAFLDDPYVSGLVVGRERSMFSGGKNPQRLLEKFNDAILKLDAEALSWQQRAARHRANPPVASTFSLEELEEFAKDRREMAEYLHEKRKRLGLSQVGSKKLPPATIDALPLSGGPRHETHRPKGRRGTNYREHLIHAPDMPASYSNRSHWDQNNAIAHARTEDRGAKTLHVFEMQSDWLQAARDKGIRDPKEIERLSQERAKLDDEFSALSAKMSVFDQKRFAARRRRAVRESERTPGNVPGNINVHSRVNWMYGLHGREKFFKPSEERAYAALNKKFDAVSNKRSDVAMALDIARAKVNAPPIPNETQAGVRMLTKSLLTRAAKEGYDKVSFARGTEVADMFNLRDAATKLELVPIESKVDAFQRTHSLRVTSKRSGQVRSFDVGPGASHSLEEYVGKGNAKLLREKGSLDAADFYDAGRAGIGDYYNEIVPNTVKAYVKELTGEPAQWVVPKSGSPYLKMTPKLKAAILAGQALPGLAGVALLSEEDRKLLGIDP